MTNSDIADRAAFHIAEMRRRAEEPWTLVRVGRDELRSLLDAYETQAEELAAWERDYGDTPSGHDIKRRLDAYETQAELLEAAREALEELIDEGPCRFDHNGHCQNHMSFGDPGWCANADARAVLSRLAAATPECAHAFVEQDPGDGLGNDVWCTRCGIRLSTWDDQQRLAAATPTCQKCGWTGTGSEGFGTHMCQPAAAGKGVGQ